METLLRKQIYLSYLTLKKMLNFRGYKIIEFASKFEELMYKIINKTYVIYAEKLDENKRCLVCIAPPEKHSFDVALFREIMKVWESKIQNSCQKDLLILLSEKGLTSYVKKTFVKTPDYTFIIQTWKYEELQINTIEHELIPKFKKLSEEECEILFEKHKTSLDKLPVLRHDDYITRYNNYRSGDVIQFERKLTTVEPYYYYRKVQ